MLSRSAGAITSRIASGIADTGAGALTGSAAPGTAAGAAAVTVRLAAGRASALTSAAAVAFASLKAAGPAQPCASAAASSGSSALIDRLESVQPALHAAYINQPFPLRNSRGEAGLVDLLQRRHKLIDMLGADPYPSAGVVSKGVAPAPRWILSVVLSRRASSLSISFFRLINFPALYFKKSPPYAEKVPATGIHAVPSQMLRV